MRRFWVRIGRWATRFSRFKSGERRVCSTNGFGTISWFLFLQVTCDCSLSDLQHAFSCALLFSLLDLDISLLQSSLTAHCKITGLSRPVAHVHPSQRKHGGPYMKSGVNSLPSLSSTGTLRLAARLGRSSTARLTAEFACTLPLTVLPCGVSVPARPATPVAIPSI